MPIHLKTGAGQTVTVDDTPWASGGEGAVYKIISPSSYKNYCVKMHYPNPQKIVEREQKIRFMINNPPILPTTGNLGDFTICWPKEIVYQNNSFFGFIMPLAFPGSIELYELTQPRVRNNLKQAWHQKYDRATIKGIESRFKLCVNIASAIYQIHKIGKYTLVDFKPQNVLVTDDGKISIIDLDSVQISENRVVRFAAKIATPEYSPLESARLTPATYIPDTWDRFSLAVVFYEVIFGIHPYTATFKSPYDAISTTSDAIQKALFVFGSNQQYVMALPPPHKNYATIPSSVKDLFFKAFVAGSQSADYRPTAEEWGKTIFTELANQKGLISGLSQYASNTQSLNNQQTQPKPQTATNTIGQIFNAFTTSPLPTPNTGQLPYIQLGGPLPYVQPPQAPSYNPAVTPVPGPSNHQTWPNPKPSSQRSTLKHVLLIGAVVALLGIVGFIIKDVLNPKAQILAKIESNYLVTPEGDSAYDLYMKNRGNFPESIKKEISGKAKSKLEEAGNALIEKMKQNGERDRLEWEKGVKIYSWLYDLEPINHNEAMKLFCEGYVFRSGEPRRVTRENWVKALELFNRAKEKISNSAIIYNQIGICALNGYKDNSAAKKWYKLAMDADRSWVMPYMNYGQLCNEMGNYDEAVNVMDEVLNRIYPGKASAYAVKGSALLNQKKFCEAAPLLQEALNRGIGSDDDNPEKTRADNQKRLKTATDQCKRESGLVLN